MELKYNWKKEKFDIRNCFNRTFMELKFCIMQRRWAPWGVLIVPLWNWNANTPSPFIIFASSFNRTFMELKYRYLKPIADHSFEF